VGDVVLHAARLTDPPETGKGKRAYPNLTLQRLPALVDDAGRDELQELVVAAGEACKTLKARRDKWIAHRDLNLALDASPNVLPGIDFGEIHHALETMRRAMNHLEIKYSRLREGYEYASSIGGGDVDSLIYYLRKGVRVEESQTERFRSGKPLAEDLEP
jgi:hypothetical protein